MERKKATFDLWADWLLKGRLRGAPQTHLTNQSSYLSRVTDRVLGNGQIDAGDHVLDVGAGTGQLAIEELRRVGPVGRVVAADLSHDALLECGRAAPADDAAVGTLERVQADATALPFREEAFDVVTTRSVVAYVSDRSQALREMQRVLKPGGRVSLYEPITQFETAPNIGTGDEVLTPIARDHHRVVAHMAAKSRFLSRLVSFDEHDLMTDLMSAGFSTIDLTFEHHVDRTHPCSAWEAQTFLMTQPHPGTMSYEEAAREVLGETADSHLVQFEELLVGHAFHLAWAVAYVAAAKQG